MWVSWWQFRHENSGVNAAVFNCLMVDSTGFEPASPGGNSGLGAKPRAQDYHPPGDKD